MTETAPVPEEEGEVLAEEPDLEEVEDTGEGFPDEVPEREEVEDTGTGVGLPRS
jgi:hypothetical protein